MKISILTIFPEAFDSFLNGPVISRAVRKGIVSIQMIDIRNYAAGSYRHIDDSPFGGGAGMIMRCEPVLKAIEAVRGEDAHVVAFTPSGQTYTQKKAHELSHLSHLVLLCGHYEGMDERIYCSVDEQISVGDYILTGGEIPAMAVADSLIRLLDGVLRKRSIEEESFENDLLEYPQYTRPAVYEGMKVPEVLLSGDHEAVRRWQLKESIRKTMAVRPDLLKQRNMTKEETEILRELEEEKQ